jgi:hypothetical protein
MSLSHVWMRVFGSGALVLLLCAHSTQAQSMNGGSFGGRLSSRPVAGTPIAALSRPINGAPIGTRIYTMSTLRSLNADPTGNSLTGAAWVQINASRGTQSPAPAAEGVYSGPGYPSSYAVGTLPNSSPRAPSQSPYGGEPELVYVPGKGFDQVPPLPQLRQRTDLQQVLIRSASLPSRNNMVVLTDGTSIILRGTAGNQRERQLAEALVRLSPGVGRVRNELDVFPPNRGPEGPRGQGPNY